MLSKNELKNKTTSMLLDYKEGKIDEEGLFNNANDLLDEAIKTWGEKLGRQNMWLHLRRRFSNSSGKIKEASALLLEDIDIDAKEYVKAMTTQKLKK